MEARELRRQFLISAVESFLDHLEEDYDQDEDYNDVEIGTYGVVCSINFNDQDGDRREAITTWISNERRWAQYGFLTQAARRVATFEDD